LASNIKLKARFDLPAVCVLCGYDLRGSVESKRCPECGDDFTDDTLVCTHEPSRAWIWGMLPGIAWLTLVLFNLHPMHVDRWTDWMIFLPFLMGLVFVVVMERIRQKPLAGNVFFQCDARGYITKTPIKQQQRKPWLPDMEMHMVLTKRGCSLSSHRGGIALLLEADEMQARWICKKLSEWSHQRVTLV
jgi:hypothetical protein